MLKKPEKHMDATKCIHCHKCQKHCDFLTKYQLDIGDIEKLNALSYNCFLCGKCSEVCPKGIDGRNIILQMRQEKVRANDDKFKEKSYFGLLFEKLNYIFKNYKGLKTEAKSVLFPGCNFVSFYPKTTEFLSKILLEKGIKTVYDCCGKPISELGLKNQEQKIISRLEKKLEKKGVNELIVLCPNCYYFLKPRLKIRVVAIYEKLLELGIGESVDGSMNVFPPCPDRESLDLLKTIKPFIKAEPNIISCAQCCGLGGCARAKELKLSNGMSEKVKNAYINQEVFTYCATCAGQFKRQGIQKTTHLLSKILKVDEEADIKNSVINRIKHKFIK